MTLKNVKLKSNYISLRDDVAEQFYIPVMSNCIRFDRVSCYFTFDAIARYCTGIYHLGKNNGKFRLLISQNVSKETFEAIREGYQGYQMLDDMVREKMRQESNSLLRIDDSFKKIIVVKDAPAPNYTDDGIRVIGVYDFLMNPDSMDM